MKYFISALLFVISSTVFSQTIIPGPTIHPALPYPINPIKETFSDKYQYTEQNPLRVPKAAIWLDFCTNNSDEVCLFFKWNKNNNKTEVIFFDPSLVNGGCNDMKFEIVPILTKTGGFSSVLVRVFCDGSLFQSAILVGEFKKPLWETIKSESSMGKIYEWSGITTFSDKTSLTNYLLVFTKFGGNQVVHQPYIFELSTEFYKNFYNNYKSEYYRPGTPAFKNEVREEFRQRIMEQKPSTIESYIINQSSEKSSMLTTEDLRIKINPLVSEKINVSQKQSLLSLPPLTPEEERKLYDALIQVNKEDEEMRNKSKNIFQNFRSFIFRR